jgi:hypothetical protein
MTGYGGEKTSEKIRGPKTMASKGQGRGPQSINTHGEAYLPTRMSHTDPYPWADARSLRKKQAHELGLLHAAYSILIINCLQKPTHMLLQKRHQDKYHNDTF